MDGHDSDHRSVCDLRPQKTSGADYNNSTAATWHLEDPHRDLDVKKEVDPQYAEEDRDDPYPES